MNYPPLTAKDFEMRYAVVGHVYPFYEDEEGLGLFAYGHDRDAEFAAEANEYDIAVSGSIAREDIEEFGYAADDVSHYWAVMVDQERYTWVGITADTPNAFPVSVLWR
jgi:hypothetical protein